MNRLSLLLPSLLAAGALHAAPAARDRAFLQDKGDVIAVAVERVRQAPDDAQRALKAGEDRLRLLHQNYQLARSTPPTSLDGDVREMMAAAERMRLARSRGLTPPADPRAQERIQALWDEYRRKAQALLEDVQYKKDTGTSENQLYWQALKEQDALADDLTKSLAYNPPPDEAGVEEAVAKDRWALLKRLENADGVSGRSSCVKTPEENPRTTAFDVAPFYRAAGLLPGANPLWKSAFEVPPGCRTVTQRAAGAKLIVRAGAGRGTLFMGGQPTPLAYSYVTVPPEVPYFVENRGDKPLDVDLIALEP